MDGHFDLGVGLLGYNLFAYCGNNPVRYADYTGENAVDVLKWSWTAAGIVSQLDSPAPGPADVIGLAIGIGGTLVAGIIFISEVLQAKTKKQTKTSDKEKASDKPSWVNKDMVDPNLTAQQNATRIMNNKYGSGNWNNSNPEFSKIVKWIQRSIFNSSVVVIDISPGGSSAKDPSNQYGGFSSWEEERDWWNYFGT